MKTFPQRCLLALAKGDVVMRAIRLIILSLFGGISSVTIFISFLTSQTVSADLSFNILETELAAPSGDTSLDKSLHHLATVMDKCHEYFWVYIDLDSPCNHFPYQARLETVGRTTMDVAFTETVHTGSTAIKGTFSGESWGGWYLQNGILSGTTYPFANWGDHPNAGHDITGATQLTFWAKGAQGGERVEFFAFGIGRSSGGAPTKTYPDSSPKVTLCGLVTSSSDTCYLTLTDTWQQYTIDLTGIDVSYVLGGFGWVTNDAQNNNQSITFYIDDIKYHGHTRLDEPRFLVSFETISTTPPITFDGVNKNVAFTYDIALALIAFTKEGNQQRAQLLADAFVYCQNHDRFYDDGRLRNAYMAGDLVTPPGWLPNGRERTCRLPGWTDSETGIWQESGEHVGSGTGNLAWAMIALLNYYQRWGGAEYLEAAITLGEWIDLHTRDERWQGGYMGGYNDWEPTPTLQLYKSTEHNIDLYVAYERLYLITGETIWHERAQYARDFVEDMWNETDGHYWTGTYWDDPKIFTDVIPLDPQTWAHHAFGLNDRTERAIEYAEDTFCLAYTYTTNSGGEAVFEGCDFNGDLDMSWPEGTGQMIVSFWLLGKNDKAQYFLNELRELQALHPNSNGYGIVSAPSDGLTTGFAWNYFSRLHIGATAWHIFAEQRHNPYWPNFQIYMPFIVR